MPNTAAASPSGIPTSTTRSTAWSSATCATACACCFSATCGRTGPNSSSPTWVSIATNRCRPAPIPGHSAAAPISTATCTCGAAASSSPPVCRWMRWSGRLASSPATTPSCNRAMPACCSVWPSNWSAKANWKGRCSSISERPSPVRGNGRFACWNGSPTCRKRTNWRKWQRTHRKARRKRNWSSAP
ncbi:hypothetical protein D9M71_389260 [compost metagenome]